MSPTENQVRLDSVEIDWASCELLERLSFGTWQKDVGVGRGLDAKLRFYAECGVREYWLYDLEGYRTDGGSVLQGFRLHAQAYREIAPGPEGTLWGSDALQPHWGLTLQQHRVLGPYAQLRVRDPETGTWYAAERQRIRERRQDKARLAAQDAQMARLKRQLGLDTSGGEERAEA